MARSKAESASDGLVAKIEKDLRRDIITGRLADGERLRQDHLAARFGTAAAPVREALRRLESQHLVEARPRRGVIVRPILPSDAVEVAEMRAALEGLAIGLSARHPDPAAAAAARKALVSVDRSRSIADWVTANRTFHLALYRGAGRPRLLAAIGNLWLTSDRHLYRVWARIAYDERSRREHAEILAAYEAGDARRARDLLEGHILSAGGALQALLSETTDAAA